MSEQGTSAAPAAAPAPASAAPAANWYDGFDTETKSYMSAKGLDKLDPVKAFQMTAKFHRDAESYLGVPREQLIRLPKDAGDTAAKEAIFSKLGKPAAKEGYDFSGIPLPQEEPDMESDFRDMAFRYGLTQEQAVGIMKEFVQNIQSDSDESLAARSVAAKETENALRKEWGGDYNINLSIAKRALERFGAPTTAVDALAAVVGGPEAVKLLAQIGYGLGEDRFITGGQGAGHILTADQAKQELAALKQDKEWAKRYLAGGVNEKKQMADLIRVAAGRN